MKGKPSEVSSLQRQKRRFAAEFDEALRIGQRGDGVPRARWVEWGNTEFAAKMPGRRADTTAVPGAVAHWRNTAKPVTPDKSMIHPILDVLYGDRFPPQRQAMLELWEMARGREQADDQEAGDAEVISDWSILGGHRTDGLAELRLHPPRLGNMPGTFYVDATLRLATGGYDFDDRTVLIGLREAFLSVDSQSYQPAKGSTIGERSEHAHFKPDVGGVRIVGPRDSRGCLAGDPLNEEYVAIIEPAGEGEAVVTVSLHAGRLAFDVTLSERHDDQVNTDVVPPTKNAVLNAVICEGLERDRQGRVILARAKMRRTIRT